MREQLTETRYAIVGGTKGAVREALSLAGRGEKAALFVRETFLATEEGMCFTHEENPDQLKKEEEDFCDRAGVEYYYGVTAIGFWQKQGRKVLLLAAKGGVYEVLCDEILVRDYFNGYNHREDSYYALTRSGGGPEEFGRFHTCFRWNPQKSTAENLLTGREKLLRAFEEEKRLHPELELGRMAYKSTGMCVPEDSHPAALLEFPYGELPNRGKTPNREGAPNREETPMEAEEEFDIVVAGGGTSGAMAALYAARGGARTVLIEPQYDLGGTSTLGGVSTYWFGMRFQDVKEVDDNTEAIHKNLGIRKRKGIWTEKDDFHPGIKGSVLLRLCLEAGVRVVFGQIAYGVLRKEKEGRNIRGVRTAGDNGNIAYFGRILIDATGDGDVAVFAGADGTRGSSRDHMTYWASLAQYTSAGEYRNNFSSMVEESHPGDLTAFIYLGRRRGEGAFDHGCYVSPRESRHILGKKVLDLKNLCRFETYEDGLYTCYSNYDPKGKQDADMIYCGFLPPQARIQIPLSALMPKDTEGKVIEGLYVAGKAISATHNVFPSIRMQADLMHQGAVLGLLGAEAVKKGMLIEDIEPNERRRLVKEATGDDLSMEVIKNWTTVEEMLDSITINTRTHWVDVDFLYEEKEANPILEAVCMEAGEILPVLGDLIERRAGKGGKKKDEALDEAGRTLDMRLKQLALWHGCDDYTEEIAEGILRKLRYAGDMLPGRKGSCKCAQLLPDHGVMPELVYELNLLSGSKIAFDMKPFEMICKILKERERDYRTIEKGIFSYVEAVAYVGERTGRKEFIPLLKELLSFPEFTEAGLLSHQVDIMTQRFQILRLILCRALALLGDREGMEGLKELKRAPSLSIQKAAEAAEKEVGQTKKRQETGQEQSRGYENIDRIW